MLLALGIDEDAAEHGGEDGVEEALLGGIDGGEAELGYDLLELLADLAGVDTVEAVVPPALFLGFVGGDFALALPVDVEVGVEGGEDIQPFRQRAERRVLAYHSVLIAPWNKVPPLMRVLRVI